MAIGKVQSRGQITLPREVRRAAQIQPGDSVTIQAVGPGTVQVRILSRLTLADLLERYPIEGPVNIAADRTKWEATAAEEVLGVVGDKNVLVDATERWRDTPGLAFVDSYLAALGIDQGCPVYTKNVKELQGQGATVPTPPPS